MVNSIVVPEIGGIVGSHLANGNYHAFLLHYNNILYRQYVSALGPVFIMV